VHVIAELTQSTHSAVDGRIGVRSASNSMSRVDRK